MLTESFISNNYWIEATVKPRSVRAGATISPYDPEFFILSMVAFTNSTSAPSPFKIISFSLIIWNMEDHSAEIKVISCFLMITSCGVVAACLITSWQALRRKFLIVTFLIGTLVMDSYLIISREYSREDES